MARTGQRCPVLAAFGVRLMAWIESHQELAGHPKTKRLMRLLGASRREVLGMLHLLWYWSLDYAPNGDLSDLTAEELADEMDWPGDPDLLLLSLIDARFLDRNGDRITIHDHDAYGGKLRRQREDNRERQRRFREARKAACEALTVTSPLPNALVTPLHNTTQDNKTSSSSPESGRAHAQAREKDDDDDDDFSPTYPTTMGKSWPIAVKALVDLFPDLLPTRIEAMLGDVERDVGPLSKPQLQAGFAAACDSLKRANGSVKHVRPYVTKVLTERLKEASNAHH